MAKHNNNAKKSRYRFLASFLAVILMLGCMMIPDTKAQASSLSLRVSTSSVKIGDTVTVSITVPAGVSATVNVTYPSGVFSFSSASDTASSNGGTVSMTIGSYGSTNTKTTGTMKFKAKAAGSATFSASAPIAGNQDGDRVTVGGASASVRVKNESNDSTNDNSNNGNHANDGEDNTHKSADNSLASLTLSSGTLSPAFKYNVTNYTAEVANDVTSVVVSAKPSNANATVESVNGGENLAVGANKIQIVVKAENGVTATYTITVTRKESGDTDDSDTPDEEDPAGTDEPQEQCYEIGGVKMYPSEDGDETQIPEGFTLSEITLWEKAYPYWVNETIGTDMGLIYLVDENKENGAWYRISEASPYDACAFLCFKSEYGYIIATPEKLTEAAPTGYVPETINIEGKGTVDAYVRDGDESTCLIYAVNQDGVYGWYRYDVQDRIYMRYTEEAAAEDTQQTEPSTEQSGSQMKDLESQMRLLFYAFIVVVAILLIVIVILLIKRKQDDDDDDDEWEEDEDDFDGHDEKENDPNDADHAEDELDLSDERTGASKRYDRSEFLTGNKATDDEAEEDEDDSEPDHAGQDEPEEEDPEVVTKPEEDPEIVTEPEEDPEVVTEPEQTPVMTNTLDLEAVLAQAVSETMHDTDDEEDYDFDDEEEEEKPKKKKEKRGFFGRKKKKKDDGDDDLEFLDL
ncbi:MAG: cadherin-like beta sandwich domain-containing protein [Lachnobacterium sp.]|nr:cadherin-like beta sandwich domain-containing protein [Lachnobacterium sp.]MDY5460862.1 cadherin-like beta sandwich domain-containing protein [Agathobacter sp.]